MHWRIFKVRNRVKSVRNVILKNFCKIHFGKMLNNSGIKDIDGSLWLRSENCLFSHKYPLNHQHLAIVFFWHSNLDWSSCNVIPDKWSNWHSTANIHFIPQKTQKSKNKEEDWLSHLTDWWSVSIIGYWKSLLIDWAKKKAINYVHSFLDFNFIHFFFFVV